jgi:hypothetical protein
MDQREFDKVEITSGVRIVLSDPLRQREKAGVVESVLRFSERYDVFIRLHDGTNIVLMVKDNIGK